MSPFTRPSSSALTSLGLMSAVLLAAAACNVGPTGAVVAIGPDAPTTSDDLVATLVTAPADEDGDNLTVTYSWSVMTGDTEAFSPRPDLVNSTVPASVTSKGQTWQVVVNATDGAEAAPESEPVSVTVVNSPPTVASVRITPTEAVDTFGTLTAFGSGSDLDGDAVTLTYTWYVNSVALEVEGTVLSGDFFNKNDQVWVEVTANDGEVDSATVASQKVSIDNTPPKLTGVVIEQELILEDTDVTCIPVGWYDADGDEAKVDATWLVNGIEVSTAAVLTGADFGKGDLIRCAGIPTDGDSTGRLYLSPVVAVGNTAPSMTGATLSDTEPGALEVVSVTPAGGADVDGDVVTYGVEWFVNGALVFTGDELPAKSFGKGDQVWAVVTPFDGLVYGEPVKSDVATAGNTAPQITSLTLLPAKLYTLDGAFPAVVGEDFDGDKITYKIVWTVNGSVVSYTGVSLSGATWFDKGDTLSVEITPNDGDDDGVAVASSTATVLNSPPKGAKVYFAETKVKADVDLVCALAAPYTDADEDDLTYSFSWSLDGSPFTGATDGTYTGDTISMDDTDDQQDWKCTLAVTDGDVTITSTASVEVRDWAGARVFSNCGASGSSGPSASQCSTTYSGTPTGLDTVTVSGGVQEWTVPKDGDYRIEVLGSAGAVGSYASGPGHKGASIRGDFTLTGGDKITIMVGQVGDIDSYGYGAGGGGGTYVVDAAGDPMIVAGGGGGNASFYGSIATCGGQSGSTATYAEDYSSYCYTASTTAGSGGTYFYDSYYDEYDGGGGGGFSGDGDHYRSYSYALAFENGGTGGEFEYCDGGFGGGGAGGDVYGGYYDECYYGGGGGGGYTGGDGGTNNGGGGGSYNDGANQVNTAASNAGNGQVTIDLVVAP